MAIKSNFKYGESHFLTLVGQLCGVLAQLPQLASCASSLALSLSLTQTSILHWVDLLEEQINVINSLTRDVEQHTHKAMSEGNHHIL